MSTVLSLLPCMNIIEKSFMFKIPQILVVMGAVTRQDTNIRFFHLILDLWLNQRQIMHIWIFCHNVLSGEISFSGNQDWKLNEVNYCLFPITMIISIDFSPFSEWKSENYQNVLSGNGGKGDHRMLLQRSNVTESRE